MGRVVMVTGVARHLGARFARLVQRHPDVHRVVGVDVLPPVDGIGDADYVRADIRSPIIAKVMATAKVDTVVHMGVLTTPRQAGGRTSMKEINVLGTMQLLAACQRERTVRRLVVKSSTAVYGSSPRDPALFTEDMDPRALPRSGFAKDSVEVEGYVRGFSRRRPDVEVTTLRLANVLGPAIETPLTSYFLLPVVPTPLGFDGRLQFLHEDDALEALLRATTQDRPGTYNVAGDGVLTLLQAVRRAGRVALPVPAPLLSAGRPVLRHTVPVDLSEDQVRFLSHGRVVDCGRLRETFGWVPERSTAATYDDFVRSRGPAGPVGPPVVDSLVDALTHLLRVPSTAPADGSRRG